jgi:hypothetical protein
MHEEVLMKRFAHVSGLVALVVLASCDSGSSDPGMSQLEIRLTDAPADVIESAEVWISRVYLQGGSEETGAHIDLFNDPDNPQSYDLLLLQDGLFASLTGTVDIPAGNYAQLRLVVDSARITLVDGTTFSDGSSSKLLKVPSGSTSGIKVQLAEAIEAEADELTIVLVDFDVAENFVFQGNPDAPAGLQGVIFTPSLHEKNRQTTDGN